jgi:hypothetical protein
LKEIQNNCGTVNRTAPAGLLDDAIKRDLRDIRVKRWLAVDHTLHLALLEIKKRETILRTCR